MKTYFIHYQEDGDYSPTKEQIVVSTSSANAYSEFMEEHNWSVYSAWVDSYLTKNGTKHYFNNFSGKAY